MEMRIIDERELFNRNFKIYGTVDEPLFLAKDICDLIEYSDGNPSSMCALIDKEEVKKIFCNIVNRKNPIESMGETNRLFVTEEGLYEILFLSRKPIAKTFKKQVKIILKEIRSTMRALKSIEYKGYIDGLVFSRDGKPITTSKILSEYTGKQHKHILRDIRDEIKELENISPNLDISSIANDFKEIFYLDSYGREQVEYELGEMATMQVLLRYSAEYRAKFILTFNKMRQAINSMFKAKVIDSVLPQDSRLRQYVYVIKNPLNETVKIGVAQDVDKRMKQLQTGAGIELELVYKSLICSNAFSIEKDVHNEFDEYRTFGEWFKINPNTVINFLETRTYILNSEYSGMLSLL